MLTERELKVRLLTTRCFSFHISTSRHHVHVHVLHSEISMLFSTPTFSRWRLQVLVSTPESSMLMSPHWLLHHDSTLTSPRSRLPPHHVSASSCSPRSCLHSDFSVLLYSPFDLHAGFCTLRSPRSTSPPSRHIFTFTSPCSGLHAVRWWGCEDVLSVWASKLFPWCQLLLPFKPSPNQIHSIWQFEVFFILIGIF